MGAILFKVTGLEQSYNCSDTEIRAYMETIMCESNQKGKSSRFLLESIMLPLVLPLCDISIKKAGLVRAALPVSLQIGSMRLFSYI